MADPVNEMDRRITRGSRRAASQPVRHRDEGGVHRGEPQRPLVRRRGRPGPAPRRHPQGRRAGSARHRTGQRDRKRPVQALAAAAPARGLRATRVPDPARPAHVVVVPVGARRLRRRVRDRSRAGEPQAGPRARAARGERGVLAGARRRALELGRRRRRRAGRRDGRPDPPVVARARHRRGAGPSGGQRARHARGCGRADAGQPVLRRPRVRPRRRRVPGAAPRRDPHRPAWAHHRAAAGERAGPPRRRRDRRWA